MDCPGFILTPGSTPVLRSSLLPVPHGFSTREGGVSVLPHLSSLNLGAGLGDTEETVSENRARFFRASLGKEPEKLMTGIQVHSDRVIAVTRETEAGQEADGYVTREKGIALFVRTADCPPILLCDPLAGVIGAVHSGWRGTVKGIAAEAVRQMVSLGADPAFIRAAIGPCIHVCCYEVGDEVADGLHALLGISAEQAVLRRSGHLFADLPAAIRLTLLRSGLRPDHILAAPDCTCCSPYRFFSHRASGGKRGLGGAVIEM